MCLLVTVFLLHVFLQLISCNRAIEIFTAKCKSADEEIPTEVAHKIEEIAQLKAPIQVRSLPGVPQLSLVHVVSYSMNCYAFLLPQHRLQKLHASTSAELCA